MVAKFCDQSIALVVEREDLGWGLIIVFQFLEFFRHGVGSVVSTEDLGAQSWHVVRQMPVQLTRLQEVSVHLVVSEKNLRLIDRRCHRQRPWELS